MMRGRIVRTFGIAAALLVSSTIFAGPPSAASSRYVLSAASVDGIRIAEVSGMAWDSDASLLYAVSDQGFLYQMRVHRQGDVLTGVEPIGAARLEDAAAPQRRFNAEAVAVHVDAAGTRELLVALEEKPPQIARFSTNGTLLGTLPVPPPADAMANYRKKGRGLESVAWHPAFGLVTAPEAPLRNTADDRHTIYAAGHAWSFPRHAPESRLKGIEVLADGSLLVLERSRPDGKEAQIASLRRVQIAGCADGSACATSLVATLPPGPENFEGMALIDRHHVLLASDNGGEAGVGTTFILIRLP